MTHVNGNSFYLPYASGIAQMCVTSPPYWGLRDYGVPGQFGLERVPDCLGWARGENCGACYVCRTVLWAREVWRVLRDDGVLFLNVGDSYNGSGKGQYSDGEHDPKKNKTQGMKLEATKFAGLKPKDLCMIPALVALALRADGWYLRQDVIWAKPNPMPESVTDRCTKAHEYVFILTKQARYFWDAEAVKEPLVYPDEKRRPIGSQGAWEIDGRKRGENGGGKAYDTYPSGRNPRSVWTIATQPYSGAHFATMPPALAEKCILAASSAKACPTCGKAWERVVEKQTPQRHAPITKRDDNLGKVDHGSPGMVGGSDWYNASGSATLGFIPACQCYGVDLAQPPSAFLDLPTVPSIVLDPFEGSGTTARVAVKHGRRAIGVELNPEYIKLHGARTTVQTVLLG